MKATLSLILSVLILLGQFTYVPDAIATPARSFVPSRDCANGSCVDEMKDLFEAKLRAAHRESCLPPNGTQNVESWAQSHPLSDACLGKIAELEELQKRLEAVSQYLAGLQDCTNCGPRSGGGATPNLAAAIEAPANQCTETRKRQIINQCDDDALCVLVSGSAAFLPATVRNQIVPTRLQNQGCNGRNDSCLVQFATGFAKAVWTLFEGLFDLLGMAARGARNSATSLWTWMTGPEVHSSNAQLAAANASQDEAVFRQLVNDFPGTMGKIWTALLATMKHWMSHGVFCQAWSGTPQFSTCTQPALGFGCTSCKAMITGMCSLTGTIMSEVVPAFLTGGLFVAAKYGASGAERLSRFIRVPQRTLTAVRNSRVSQFVVRTSAAASSAVRTSRVTTANLAAARSSINAIAPSIRGLKETLASLRQAITASGAYIMRTPAGPVLTIGLSAARTAGRVLILPLDNALLRSSFSLGGRSMESVLRAGGNAVRVARGGTIAARTTGVVDPVETAFVRMELNPNGRNQLAYVEAIKENRAARIPMDLNSRTEITFNELLEEFYPDLDYGKYSSLLTASGIERAESELFNIISALPDGAMRSRLIRDYQGHVSSAARSAMSSLRTFPRENVISNSSLADEARLNTGIEVAGVDPGVTNPSVIGRMREGLRRARTSPDAGVLHETPEEIRDKIRILTESGFSDIQAQRIFRSGVVSTPRPEDLFPALRSVAIPEVTPQVMTGMSRSPAYITIFSGVSETRQPAVARALKILEQDGSSAERVADTYRRFQSHFIRVQKNAAGNSDPESLMAQFIRRERQAGKSDAQIGQQLDEAFRACR